MKPPKTLKPLDPIETKVKELNKKKKAGENTKDILERIEEKLDLLLSKVMQ